MTVSNLHPDEIEDCQCAIRRAGLDPADFILGERVDPGRPHSGPIFALAGAIGIRYERTGVVRTYQTGNGSAWPAEFQRDLEAGRFLACQIQ